MPSWLISPHPSKGKARLTSKGSLRFLQMRESHEAPWWRWPLSPTIPHRSMQTPGRTPQTPPGPGRVCSQQNLLVSPVPICAFELSRIFPKRYQVMTFTVTFYTGQIFPPLFSRKQRLYSVRTQVSVAFQHRPQASFSLNHSHVSGCWLVNSFL